MTVTAIIVLLAAVGLGMRITLGVHRALIGRRSSLTRLVVGVAGLGYGLADALRGTLLGLVLAGLGATAIGVLLRDLRRILCRLANRRFALRSSDQVLGAAAPATIGSATAATRARGIDLAHSRALCLHAATRTRLRWHDRPLG